MQYFRHRLVTYCVAIVLFIAINAALLSSCSKSVETITVEYVEKARLGKLLFFDTTLSNPVGQSCASCHNPATGFSDGGHQMVSQGAVKGLFGNRNAPSIGYNVLAPSLFYDADGGSYVGGFFLDGRANTLAMQAKQPFLNPLEMNNHNAAAVVAKVKQAPYYSLFTQVYGSVTDVNTFFENIADALSAYELTPDLNRFTSKFDYVLKKQASFTAQELQGWKLFNDTAKAKCAKCHISEADDATGKVLFTDFTYDNIGVPANTANPFYTLPSVYNPLGKNAIDKGLGGFLKDSTQDGKFKVPSLRNVAVSAPYFHNGVFNTLEEVVHFYNKRDVEKLGMPEITRNVNKNELGNLGLTDQEEKAVVAFLKTLTDGYR